MYLLCQLEDKFFDLSLYMDGIIKALVYVMLYMGWSVIFNLDAFVLPKESFVQ